MVPTEPSILAQWLLYLFLLIIVGSAVYLLGKIGRAWRDHSAIQPAPTGSSASSDEPSDPVPHPQAVQGQLIRILFLAANPSGTEPLRLAEEIRAIDHALYLAKFRDRFELEQQWAVRISDLQSHLLRYRPNIVHFSGHGSEASEIILEDETGKSQPVPTAALGQLFGILKDNVRCVVLNACYSEEQALAIAQSIECVVGMSNAIQDQAAIRFAAAFYQALAYGRNVKTAFDLGVSQLNLESLSAADVPRLVTRNSNPEAVTFVHDE